MILKEIASPFYIGQLKLSHRLIQGPLAGTSASPFRRLFYQFLPPAYAVSEMISAHDILVKHQLSSRYIHRAPEENILCYQIAGSDPDIMAKAAQRLQLLGADLIDINCGCPKAKIRKKGAGSALMDDPEHLVTIAQRVRDIIQIPLTIKLRLYGTPQDLMLAQRLENIGVDALIIHGRRWTDDYTKPCDYKQIGLIKQHCHIPIIANGDISDVASLTQAITESRADAYMISRAGCGRPWLYKELINQIKNNTNLNLNSEGSKAYDIAIAKELFFQHLNYLTELESEYLAVMQSRSFFRYYFKNFLSVERLQAFNYVSNIAQINSFFMSKE